MISYKETYFLFFLLISSSSVQSLSEEKNPKIKNFHKGVASLLLAIPTCVALFDEFDEFDEINTTVTAISCCLVSYQILDGLKYYICKNNKEKIELKKE